MKKNSYASHSKSIFNPPQSEPIPGKKMVKNSAGGFVFQISDIQRLERFLVLGSLSNTYYASAKELTKDNVLTLVSLAQTNPHEYLATLLEFNKGNRIPKHSNLLYAYALLIAHSSIDTTSAFKLFVRNGSHILEMASCLKALGVLNKKRVRALFGSWINADTVSNDNILYQSAKYQNREGWTWKDLIRIVHPKANNAEKEYTLGVLVGKKEPKPETFLAYLQEAKTCSESRLIDLILNHSVSHEMIPSERITKNVLAALAVKMPATALLRNLGRLGSHGLIDPLSEIGMAVSARLEQHDYFRESRVHPVQVLLSLFVYKNGSGYRSKNTWTPNPRIVKSLEDLFYGSFGFIEQSDKRMLLALDVSGSMSMGDVAQTPGLTPAIASAVMAMVQVRSCPNTLVMGFSDKFKDLKINATDSLESAFRKTVNMNFGGTDCSLPFMYARKQALPVDGFVVYTDNETWAGSSHPSTELKNYRKASGINAKSVVVGMTATQCSIADPNDPGMMDVCGFDTNVPQIINQFFS